MNVSSLSSTSATAPVGPPPGHHHGGGPEKTVQAVADRLGMDSESTGSSGTGIADLLAQNPDVSGQLAQLQNRGALVDGYV